MALNIPNATAICHDCHKQVASGSLTLDLEIMVMSGRPVIMEGKQHMITMASNDLVRQCAQHHDLLRDPRKDDLPRHDIFTVKQKGRIIGEFSPPASVSEVSIRITDNEIINRLQGEASITRREKDY